MSIWDDQVPTITYNWNYTRGVLFVIGFGLLLLKSVFCTVFTFKGYFHRGWLKKLVVLRTKRDNKNRFDFKIDNPVVRIKHCAKIALKNRGWNYGKKSQWNFSMTEEICTHCKNAKKVSYLFKFLEETRLSVLKPVSSISPTYIS